MSIDVCMRFEYKEMVINKAFMVGKMQRNLRIRQIVYLWSKRCEKLKKKRKMKINGSRYVD